MRRGIARILPNLVILAILLSIPVHNAPISAQSGVCSDIVGCRYTGFVDGLAPIGSFIAFTNATLNPNTVLSPTDIGFIDAYWWDTRLQKFQYYALTNPRDGNALIPSSVHQIVDPIQVIHDYN